MVLQNKLDCQLNDHFVPSMPRASESARGKGSIHQKCKKNSMYAFDLLATVAGKLLEERADLPEIQFRDLNSGGNEGSIDNDCKMEEPFTRTPSHQRSCQESNCIISDNAVSEVASMISTPEQSKKRNIPPVDAFTAAFNLSRDLIGMFESRDRPDDKIESGQNTENPKTPCKINGASSFLGRSEGSVLFDDGPLALARSDTGFEVPLCQDHICRSYLTGYKDNVGNKDNEENSFICNPRKSGDPGCLCPAEKLVNDSPQMHVTNNKRTSYTRQRTQRDSSGFKKRKLFQDRLFPTTDEGIEATRCSSQMLGTEKCAGFSITMRSADGAESAMMGPKDSFISGDTRVKLCIKSFKVPELFIEASETETVGSLKRKVLEAASAILGGGLQVGILLQGKKVKDDTKTLLQTGISDGTKLDSLGFTLEPNPTVYTYSSPLCTTESCIMHNEVVQPVNGCPVLPTTELMMNYDSCGLLLTNTDGESGHDSISSPLDACPDGTPSSSKEMYAASSVNEEALAVVPVHRKSRRSEFAQRRIRRPFAVSEVEALVQAVEKLGTGRWRDVKLCAFENAKHRTYVDLKDKWKTLVHTARISPQQRRGEPVPQELLDRVLLAHASWSQQQTKPQVKLHYEASLLP